MPTIVAAMGARTLDVEPWNKAFAPGLSAFARHHVERRPMQRFFAKIASKSAYLMGHPMAFLISAGVCILWAVTGPLFHYSDTWQLVINTGTTVLTFLAVFLIQNSQNRDGAAIQAKLDEILRAVADARSGFVGIEKLTDEEIGQIKTALEREVLQNAKGAPDIERTTVDKLLEERSDLTNPS